MVIGVAWEYDEPLGAKIWPSLRSRTRASLLHARYPKCLGLVSHLLSFYHISLFISSSSSTRPSTPEAHVLRRATEAFPAFSRLRKRPPRVRHTLALLHDIPRFLFFVFLCHTLYYISLPYPYLLPFPCGIYIPSVVPVCPYPLPSPFPLPPPPSPKLLPSPPPSPKPLPSRLPPRHRLRSWCGAPPPARAPAVSPASTIG